MGAPGFSSRHPDPSLAAPAQGTPDGAGRPWPEERLVGRASLLKVGVWAFLVADALSFAGLLLAYGVLRVTTPEALWHPPDEPAFGVAFTAALTFLLIVSSVTMVVAVSAARAHRRGAALTALALTMLGGLLFLGGQAFEYFGAAGHPGLIARGLHWGVSPRATTFFAITGFHGLHVAAGVVMLGWFLLRTARRGSVAQAADALEAGGLFWHFVDLVWILVFTFVYLVPDAAGSALPL